MKYSNITTATFLSRPNRFIAQVRLFDGTEETVHVKNTGRCRELLIPGCTVYLEKSENPNRKTLYDLVAVEKRYDQVSNWENYPLVFQKRMKNGVEKSLLFNIDSQAPNKVVLEWLQNQDYSKIKPEYTLENQDSTSTWKNLMKPQGKPKKSLWK